MDSKPTHSLQKPKRNLNYSSKSYRMADSMLFDIAGEIILRLGSQAIADIALWWGVADEIDRLKRTVSSIQAVILDAEEQQELNHQIRDWLLKLKEAVLDADDLLDDFLAEGLQRKLMEGRRMAREVRIFFSKSNRFVYGLKVGHKIRDLRLRLDDINKDREAFKLEIRPVDISPASNLRYQNNSSVPEIVVGRDGDRDKIVGLMLGLEDKIFVSTVSVVGIGGLGKSTLAQLVFNNEQIKHHFAKRLWVCVSEPFDAKTIVQKILESASGEKAEDLELDTLKNRLDESLDRKRFLLVLDDVWNEDQEKWDSLKRLLVIKQREGKEGVYVRGQTGSVILVTTRSQKVAAIVSPLNTHLLEGLSESKSWSLLVKLVFGGEEPKKEHVVKIGKEIVRKCVGVPLAIKTVASLLSLKNPETEWLPFLENELPELKQSENDILPTLRLSYNYLPSHLKHCFKICALFPKDHVFDVKLLIGFWIAQGFVRSQSSDLYLEVVGLGYFMELSSRSFFQELTRDVFGNVISCKMHDLMHDLAILVGGKESKLMNSNAEHIDHKTRHVSYSYSLDSSWKFPTNLLQAKQLRTFLLPSQATGLIDNWRWRKPTNEVIFSTFRRLRAFDLRGLGIERLSSIKKLKHLRYLDASKNSGITKLPNSVTKLLNLQVLNLSGCENLIELPKGIRKLVNLRVLDCEGCSSLSHMPSGIGQLTSLQALAWFVSAKNCSVSKHIASLNELGRLNRLRGGLEIRNLGYAGNSVAELNAPILKEKPYLQSLVLTWNGNSEGSDVNEGLLEKLEPNPNLKGLKVYHYRGLSFPSWLSYLENVVELWIVKCRRCWSLPPLDKIPFLKELWLSELDELEYIETEENNGLRRGRKSLYYPSLKKLWIWHCPNLKGWWKTRNGNEVRAAAMEPGIGLMDVRNCPRLTWMPLILSVKEKLDFNNVNLESLELMMNAKVPNRLGSSRLLNQLSSPANLAVIWLKDCYGCKHLPPLDQVHSLKELYLDNLIDLEFLDYAGNNSLDADSPFCASLKKLWIWNCPNLKGWQRKMDNDATATPVAQLPYFPRLSLLEIKHCPELISMPLFPSLQERLYYVDSGSRPLLQTMNMKINGTLPLAGLQEFWISELPDLEYIMDDAEYILYWKEMGLKFFSSLNKLWIYSCPNLRGWWKNGDENSEKTTEFPHFPCLSLLEIKYCPNLNCMPLFPTLEERLYYVDTGIEPLQQTMKMNSESTFASPLMKVKELWISDLPELEYIDWDEDKYVGEEAELVFPSLEKLWIYNCPNLKGWWKRTRGDDTKESTGVLPQFPGLSLLEIKHCPKLSWMPLFPFLDQRLYYVKTGIEPLLQSISISSFSSLEELWLSELSDLEYIDSAGYSFWSGGRRGSVAFLSLKKLWIDYCPNFEGWWKNEDDDTTSQMPQFRFLSLLEIKHCPKLSCMPLFPSLNERLYYVKAGVEPLLQTMRIKTNRVSPLEKIQELWLSELDDLVYIDSNDFSTADRGSMVYPSLKKLWIGNCPNLKGWWRKMDGNATPTTVEIPRFPCLSVLEIKHCPNLSCLPLFPSIDERLYYVNAGVQPLQQSVKLSRSFSSFANLKELWISDMTDLVYINCEEYERGKAGSTVFPSLEKLWIYNCPNLVGWWKKIDSRKRILKAVDPPRFPSLSLLEIKNCPELSQMPLFPTLKEKLHLEGSNIEHLQQTMELKTGDSVQPLSKLNSFWIMAIEDLEFLPKIWLRNLVALQELHIVQCPKLASLPREMQLLSSLQKLQISGCHLLTERCRRNDGEDWHNIAHIPDIETDF